MITTVPDALMQQLVGRVKDETKKSVSFWVDDSQRSVRSCLRNVNPSVIDDVRTRD